MAVKPSHWRERLLARWAVARPHLIFVLALLFIDVVVNLRYPGYEQSFWYLTPSVDVVAVFAYFALFGWKGWRVPRLLRVVLVFLLFFVRLLRLGDGVQEKYFSQSFNLYTDLPLVGELVRFAHSTLPGWRFAAGAAAAVVALVGIVVACYAALGYAERYLSHGPNALVFAAIAGLSFVAVSPVGQDPEYADHWFGGLAVSAVPRIKHEVRFLYNVSARRSERMQAIAQAQRRLEKTPSNLAKLHHANVYLIFVESYGRTVFDRPFFTARARERFETFESDLVDRGFAIVSGTITSPTYGGHSWLAHTTLATGIQVADELQYELVSASKPKTIARIFHDAGYRTVLAAPGTTREWPKGEFYQFDAKYYLWNFGYAGPDYAWATMPDQFVLDFVRRSELKEPKGPLFIQYNLVSSHAPWSDLPTVVNDWDKLGNGALFETQQRMKYPIVWPYFENASQAYIDSIMYDFEVLKRYITQYVLDDSLVIILGDHQPVAEVNGRTQFTGVPVHVLSRDGALVEPFAARGFGRGMWPPNRFSYAPMSSFLVNLLQDYSTREETPAP